MKLKQNKAHNKLILFKFKILYNKQFNNNYQSYNCLKINRIKLLKMKIRKIKLKKKMNENSDEKSEINDLKNLVQQLI